MANSIIVRYVTGCKINEILLGFYDVSDNKCPLRLADVIETPSLLKLNSLAQHVIEQL